VSTELKMAFDDVADLYDAVRPGYPDDLVNDVCSILPGPNARMLEIGCGTGQATKPFARRGCKITAVEPGLRLAAIAARNLASFPNVNINAVTFEDWPIHEGSFDMVMSATAFHWVSPEARYTKTAQALTHGGWLAIYWNIDDRPDGPQSRRIQDVYDRCLPAKMPSHPYSTHHPAGTLKGKPEKVQKWIDEIDESELYGSVAVHEYRWTERYPTDRFLQLLETYSDHHTLPAENKQCLFDGIAEVLRDYDNIFEKHYLSVLYLAQKRA
jgi:SAM-dependent methyltransferase